MKRVSVILASLCLFAVTAATPAAGDSGNGELIASFHAGLSGGSAIDVHSAVADAVASPQVNPAGRIEPFGAPEFICDQLVVGTWVFVFDPDPAVLDGLTGATFKLDGEVLDTVRTPNKRIAQGEFKGWWWFAEGVPVIGVLDPGLHEIEWQPFPDLTFTTPVDVDSAYC